MNKKTLQTISAKIVAHTKNVEEDGSISEAISYELCFPRIILSELLTHRRAAKSTSSSRAIPFSVNAKTLINDYFLPLAYQEKHSGMQGKEYLRGQQFKDAENFVKMMFDNALRITTLMDDNSVTKQICNRYLEPFTWVRMVFTISPKGLNNLFHLRCPKYMVPFNKRKFKSKNEVLNYFEGSKFREDFVDYDWYAWQDINEGSAEIHFMELAERMFDTYKESTPRISNIHIPYLDLIQDHLGHLTTPQLMRVSTSLCARTSYTPIGNDRKVKTLEKELELYQLLVDEEHWSPLEGPCILTSSSMLKDLEPSSHMDGFTTFRDIIMRTAKSN